MRKGLAPGLLLGWLLGIGTGLIGLALAGGWYEYDWHGPGACEREKAVALSTGWEVVPYQPDPCYFRRPRFRLDLSSENWLIDPEGPPE